jgi:AMMECR1 domain-containing protein
VSNAEPLGAAARAALRALAREAIERAARGEPPAAAPARHPTRLPEIERRGGAFVTLRLRGRLRGCIGRVSAEAPLADVVPAMARAAALDDPRFDPIGPRGWRARRARIASSPSSPTSETGTVSLLR